MNETISINGHCYSKEEHDEMIAQYYKRTETMYCKAFKCYMSKEKCQAVSLARIKEVKEFNQDVTSFKLSTPCLTCENNKHADFDITEYESESKICHLAEYFPEMCPSEANGIKGKFFINASFTASNFKNTRYCCNECRNKYNRIKRLQAIFRKNRINAADIDPDFLWNEKDFADFLCITKTTIANWRISDIIKPCKSSNGKRGFLYNGQSVIDLMTYLKMV